MKVVSHSFRPLSGSYISQYIRMMQCFCVTLFPSPIGELHFSIRIVNHLQVQNVFPSPIGELHFSIVTCKLANKTFSKFPSPIGELHFSILEKDTMKVVSHSFRPLSGSYISQYIRMMQCFCVTLFPSPIGELHFSIRIVNHLQVQNVFPSPIGELHFSIITGKNEKELFTPVSVPYRGATFLNRYS